MSRIINPNFLQLRRSLQEGKSGVVLEGGSRSRKTWSGIDFVIYLCSRVETKCTINIVKETYNSFKTTLYEDFNRRLPDFEIKSPFEGVQEKPSFYLLGSKINLLGADKSASLKHGVGSDYTWYNESLDIPRPVFDQTEMRTRKFWWMDYNPKFTDHWIFDNVCNREDVSFLRTSMLDNPYISAPERRKILSYEDTPENRKNGTVDLYNWTVYGLGQRAARTGLIFPDVDWIETFPTNIERVIYGMDFGWTNDPTAIVKVGFVGDEIYLELMYYSPTEDYTKLRPIFDAIVGEGTCWADSSDGKSSDKAYAGVISDFRRDGYNVFAVNKFNGSIKYGIDLMKRKRIHIVRNPDARKEQENYCWETVNGISLNIPIDKFNHFWDASRYVVLSENRFES